jgi:hypothetical protein
LRYIRYLGHFIFIVLCHFRGFDACSLRLPATRRFGRFEAGAETHFFALIQIVAVPFFTREVSIRVSLQYSHFSSSVTSLGKYTRSMASDDLSNTTTSHIGRTPVPLDVFICNTYLVRGISVHEFSCKLIDNHYIAHVIELLSVEPVTGQQQSYNHIA